MDSAMGTDTASPLPMILQKYIPVQRSDPATVYPEAPSSHLPWKIVIGKVFSHPFLSNDFKRLAPTKAGTLRPEMEDLATQPSTQPYADPRRVGYNNSGLNEQDVADVICILHPSSVPAHNAVATTAQRSPQHILQDTDLEYDFSDRLSPGPNRDVALRLSSPVKDPTMGFCFGRNPDRCDVMLTADDSEKKVSNVHFRIYLKEDGILMLHDLSTNGTVVDDTRLWKKGNPDSPSTQMLQTGSVIQVVGSDASTEIKFIVRIPPREGYDRQYMQNLVQYFYRVQKLTEKANPKYGTLPVRKNPQSQFIVPPAPSGNTHGMHWSGGSEYNVTGQIGKGAFATVYRLATKKDGIVYAAKELDKRKFMKNGILDLKVENEMKIMKCLRHPNIVQYESYYDHERWIYIIMEYVPCGELSTFLNENGEIPEDMVRSIARQILHALRYLHKRKITHRDIKPDNILISSLDPLRVKLSDFGLSKVVREETFLKTFCGTLLYCAPEVYPEYDSYKKGEARKRRRLGDPLPKTSPYDQSVDMWSLGAVLYHILCGKAPYTGRGDDRGAQMLRNIMTIELDYSVLRNSGVSESGIDFVSKLLNRDPRERPKERECFAHPWISEIPDVYDYMDVEEIESDQEEGGLPVINEDNESGELDASQLSLNDYEDFESASDGENGAEGNEPKRQRLNNSGGQSNVRQSGVAPPTGEVRYPSLPSISGLSGPPHIQVEQPTAPPNRLFGEISNSALRSSGVLGQEPGPMLDHQLQYQNEGVSVHDFGSVDEPPSGGESFISERKVAYPRSFLAAEHRGISNSSLMGAETLVGQLNMESPDSANTGPPTPDADNPARPRTPETRNTSPHNDPNARSEESSNAEPTPKVNQFSRRIELPPPASFEGSSFIEALAANHNTNGSRRNPGSHGNSQAGSEAGGPHPSDQFGPPMETNFPATETNTSFSVSSETGPGPEDFANVETVSESDETRPKFGKLTSLPGSIVQATIPLESRMTSWGRGPKATIRYPNPMDGRIPQYALELTFWVPSIESRIAAGEDWMSIPDVMTILSTKTSKCIWVNDIALHRVSPDKDGYSLFGKLYTGDIITVYRSREQYMKFRCEFYHGESAGRRPESEKGFIIEKAGKPKEA
ncbi:hypothetical protein FQN54_009243 [Arachnomyces sp. PD_36]|nr:hypothetical protein FQN54_009243 [Arachnomyces sp. PD_36]